MPRRKKHACSQNVLFEEILTRGESGVGQVSSENEHDDEHNPISFAEHGREPFLQMRGECYSYETSYDHQKTDKSHKAAPIHLIDRMGKNDCKA